MQYFVKYVDENTVFPNKELLSAVFLIALDGTKILAIQNERGWEIPGGHIEKGETYEEALVREVEEEGGASFSNPKLLAIIESDNQDIYKDTVMLIYTTKNFKLGKFTPSEDALDREVIEINEFLERYKSENDFARIDFAEVISRAQDLIK